MCELPLDIFFFGTVGSLVGKTSGTGLAPGVLMACGGLINANGDELCWTCGANTPVDKRCSAAAPGT
eukprot:scaffold196601_cov30-Tisochrysis_lutea.AAC.1